MVAVDFLGNFPRKLLRLIGLEYFIQTGVAQVITGITEETFGSGIEIGDAPLFIRDQHRLGHVMHGSGGRLDRRAICDDGGGYFRHAGDISHHQSQPCFRALGRWKFDQPGLAGLGRSFLGEADFQRTTHLRIQRLLHLTLHVFQRQMRSQHGKCIGKSPPQTRLLPLHDLKITSDVRLTHHPALIQHQHQIRRDVRKPGNGRGGRWRRGRRRSDHWCRSRFVLEIKCSENGGTRGIFHDGNRADQRHRRPFPRLEVDGKGCRSLALAGRKGILAHVDQVFLGEKFIQSQPAHVQPRASHQLLKRTAHIGDVTRSIDDHHATGHLQEQIPKSRLACPHGFLLAARIRDIEDRHQQPFIRQTGGTKLNFLQQTFRTAHRQHQGQPPSPDTLPPGVERGFQFRGLHGAAEFQPGG